MPVTSCRSPVHLRGSDGRENPGRDALPAHAKKGTALPSSNIPGDRQMSPEGATSPTIKSSSYDITACMLSSDPSILLGNPVCDPVEIKVMAQPQGPQNQPGVSWVLLHEPSLPFHYDNSPIPVPSSLLSRRPSGQVSGDSSATEGELMFFEFWDTFFMMVGVCLSLETFWTFPLLTARHGGAFIVASVVMFVVLGLPLLYLEVVMGQFCSRGIIGVYECFPLLKGAPHMTMCCCFLLAVCHTMRTVYCLMVLVHGLTDSVPWSKCKDSWRNNCYTPDTAFLTCKHLMRETLPSTSQRSQLRTQTVKNVSESVPKNEDGHPIYCINATRSSAEAYLIDYIWELSTGIQDTGRFGTEHMVYLTVIWFFVVLICFQSPECFRESLRIITMLTTVLFIAFFIRRIASTGAIRGIGVLFSTMKLTSVQMWIEAAEHVMFSMGTCTSVAIFVGSQCRFGEPLVWCVVPAAVLNMVLCVLAAMLTWTTMYSLHLVEDMKSTAVFFPYKQIIVAMQIIINTGNSAVWTTVIFVCYIFAGMISHILLMKASVTYVSRLFKQDPDEPPFRTLIDVCAAGYICCIPFCTGCGVYLNYVLEGGIARNIAIVVAWIEILGLILFYGVHQIDTDIEYMLDRRLHYYWIASWVFSLPLLTVAVFFYHSFELVDSTFHLDSYEYPSWTKRAIASVSLISTLPVPIWTMRRIVGMDFDIKKSLQPEATWGPSDPDLLSEYHDLREGRQPAQRQLIDIVMEPFQNEVSAKDSVVEEQSDKQGSRSILFSGVGSGVGSSPPSPAELRKLSPLKIRSETSPTTRADGTAGTSSAWATSRTGTPRPPSGGKDSADSGVYDLDEDIITELSAPEKVLSVERSFKPPGKVNDLVVEGKQCPRRLSEREREKKEEEEILDRLRGEGLAVRPGSKASGGMCFEVAPADSSRGSHRLPPLHVEKSRKHKRKETRAESIEEKLQKAEVRRKHHTDEKLKKARALSGKARRSVSQGPKEGLVDDNITHAAEDRKKTTEEVEENHDEKR